MKRISIALLALVFLASCAGKYGVMKRRYNKGYYIAHSSKINNPVQHNEQKEIKAEKLAAKNNLLEQSSQNTKDVSATSLQTIAFSKFNSEVKTNVKKPEPVATAATKFTDQSIYHLKTIDPLLNDHSKTKPKKSNDGDVMKVLLVIMCLFPIIALIAIYLHDGDITLNFWIDLLLHFVLLWWLFGILVVLDVVDLR